MIEQDNNPPDPLPLTLPKGTLFMITLRFIEAAEFSEINGCYIGEFESMIESGKRGGATPEQVDWRSYRSIIAAQDRPIQAGDWVECVADSVYLPELILGNRYQVTEATQRKLLLLQLDGLGYAPARFKRVDGPHPEAKAWACPPHRFNDFGKCVECGEFQGETPRDSTSPHRICLTCSSPATKGQHCAYCWHNTDGGESYAPALEASRAADTVDEDATATLLSGLESERVRPVGSTKALAELVKAHPWECDE